MENDMETADIWGLYRICLKQEEDFADPNPFIRTLWKVLFRGFGVKKVPLSKVVEWKQSLPLSQRAPSPVTSHSHHGGV